MNASHQAYLLDRYYRALKRNHQAKPPEGLDAEVAAIARALITHVKVPEPSPGDIEHMKANIFGGENQTVPPAECRCHILRRYAFRCQSCPVSNRHSDETELRPSLLVPLKDGPDCVATEQGGQSDESLELVPASAGQAQGAAVVLRRGLPRVVSSTGMLPPDLS